MKFCCSNLLWVLAPALIAGTPSGLTMSRAFVYGGHPKHAHSQRSCCATLPAPALLRLLPAVWLFTPRYAHSGDSPSSTQPQTRQHAMRGEWLETCGGIPRLARNHPILARNPTDIKGHYVWGFEEIWGQWRNKKLNDSVEGGPWGNGLQPPFLLEAAIFRALCNISLEHYLSLICAGVQNELAVLDV